ncbi:RidA family protein [Flavicella sp.]|uniref:RidA family protein n=1 Tax=Flavicella sp. TaxID=2957742 RepID=UPI0026376B31|nr:RidA family protein [Flavicella sp.]MDG1805007.1 RidA family protein [Flavicella sp.]
MSKRILISSGSSFEEEIGYSRAVIRDNWVFVSGTTGYDYATMTIAEDIVDQTEQCFLNIISTLEKANASLIDVVRVNYIVPVAQDFEKCWPVLRRHFGDIKPAATMISAGLADKKMKIEIEVTALKK